MKVNINVELKPFTVPHFVLTVSAPKPRQEGFTESQKYALSDLDASILDKLCNQFRDDVFDKAGKRQPPREA